MAHHIYGGGKGGSLPSCYMTRRRCFWRPYRVPNWPSHQIVNLLAKNSSSSERETRSSSEEIHNGCDRRALEREANGLCACDLSALEKLKQNKKRVFRIKGISFLHSSFLHVHVQSAQDGRAALADAVALASVAHVNRLRDARAARFIVGAVAVNGRRWRRGRLRCSDAVHHVFRHPKKNKTKKSLDPIEQHFQTDRTKATHNARAHDNTKLYTRRHAPDDWPVSWHSEISLTRFVFERGLRWTSEKSVNLSRIVAAGPAPCELSGGLGGWKGGNWEREREPLLL